MTAVVVVLVLVLLAGAAVAARRRQQLRQREQREAELAPVRRLALDDVAALGDQMRDLDADVAGQELDDGARADYQRALDAYESAGRAMDQLDDPDELSDVTRIIDDGRYAIACVRARLAGEPLPTRRPPCFFDPRHGMAVTDVAFRPPGGIKRDVPACALDAERVEAGADPDVRQVMVGTKRVPYWEGGRGVDAYASGYFTSALMMNAMFAGLMFGAMTPDPAFGYDGGYDGGGDFGSGDFGGGDFGGGDFGGGF